MSGSNQENIQNMTIWETV